jgi:hypothetical protein
MNIMGKTEETDHWEDLDITGRIILKSILDRIRWY